MQYENVTSLVTMDVDINDIGDIINAFISFKSNIYDQQITTLVQNINNQQGELNFMVNEIFLVLNNNLPKTIVILRNVKFDQTIVLNLSDHFNYTKIEIMNGYYISIHCNINSYHHINTVC
eukprot:8143_1